MSEPRVTQHVFPISHGRAGAPIGTREWADSLRFSLVAMVDHLGEEDDRLWSYLEFAKKHRAWTLMNKPDGSFFSTIEEFCAFRCPYGLGKSWAELRPFLVAAMAKRGTPHDEIERTLQLEAVPEAMLPESQLKAARAVRWADKTDASLKGNDCPSEEAKTPQRAGKAAKAEASLGGNDCPSEPPTMPERTIKQLRAINRAPDAIKDAYREGRISQTLAAKLGPRNPKPEAAAHIAEIAAKIRQVPDRKAVDSMVREHLHTPASTAVDRAVRALERMSREQRSQFFLRVEALRAESVA